MALVDTVGATIAGLTIDGGNQGANLAQGQNNATEVGISAINATGTVLNHDTITNVEESGAGFGAQRGWAVYAANSASNSANTFEIENSTVSNFQKNGITVINAAATVTGNTVTGTVTILRRRMASR